MVRQAKTRGNGGPERRSCGSRRFLLAAVCCLLLGLLAPAQAQRPAGASSQQKDERFHAATYLIMVDVMVTGKKGRPVLDLTEEDFRVFEDGVEQTIDYFHIERLSEPEAEREEAREVAEPDEQTILESNVLVLLLDYSTTTFSNQKRVRKGAEKFIREAGNDADLLAVFAFDSGLRTLQNLTSDRELVLEALRHSGSRGEAMAGERAALDAGAGRAVADQKALSQRIGSLVEAASRAPGATLSPAIAMAMAQLELARASELRYYSLQSSLDNQLSRSVLLALQAVSDGLRPFPGRKALVLISEGFVLHPNARTILEETLASSLRSNVSIYSIDARGVLNDKPVFETTQLESISPLQRGARTRVIGGESQFDRAAMIGTDQAESILRYLATSTGGLYVRDNNVARSLEKIDEDMHAHYLLGYTTSNKNMDGRFRKITVEVLEEDLKVRARKGYYATP